MNEVYHIKAGLGTHITLKEMATFIDGVIQKRKTWELKLKHQKKDAEMNHLWGKR